MATPKSIMMNSSKSCWQNEVSGEEGLKDSQATIILVHIISGLLVPKDRRYEESHLLRDGCNSIVLDLRTLISQRCVTDVKDEAILFCGAEW